MIVALGCWLFSWAAQVRGGRSIKEGKLAPDADAWPRVLDDLSWLGTSGEAQVKPKSDLCPSEWAQCRTLDR